MRGVCQRSLRLWLGNNFKRLYRKVYTGKFLNLNSLKQDEIIMRIEKISKNGLDVAHVIADEVIIKDLQSATDMMMGVRYETGIKNIAISKDLFADGFFILSSGLAGEILQKFVNYRFRIAVYGDYSKYTSKPLKDFIYESNKGRDIFFTDNLEIAVEKLTKS